MNSYDLKNNNNRRCLPERLFAQAVTNVSLLDINTEENDGAAAETKGMGVKSVTINSDAGHKKSVSDAMEKTAAEPGGLHIAVNNA